MSEAKPIPAQAKDAWAFPKRLGHIWVGDRPAPEDWMRSWPEKHPGWDYKVYDNAYLTGRRWRTQIMINEYFKRKAYAGVSDLMRYELLFERGGFLPEADSICLTPVDDLFTQPTVYSVYENETKKPGFVTPYLAAAAKHMTLKRTIRALINRFGRDPTRMRKPWRSVGNLFLKTFVEQQTPEVTILPSHLFNPQHKRDERYNGTDTIYAEQLWGSTMDRYDRFAPETEERLHRETLQTLKAKIGT